MESSGRKLIDNWRLFAIAAFFFFGIVFLAARLHDVQVVRASDFSEDLKRQSLRRVQESALRGRIFDRNGETLADNRPSYCIACYVEEFRRRGKWSYTIDAVNETIDRLATNCIGRPRMISHRAVSNHVMQTLPMPLLAWRGLSRKELAMFEMHRDEYPGVDIYIQPERRYPQGTLANHVLGYVRRDKPRPLPGEKIHFFLPEMVGRAGIEATANDVLTGMPGAKLLRVDARGYKTDEWSSAPAVPGKDIYLTIDVKLQRALELALEGKRGAGVVVDPRNGDILAMASAPAYDPNEFVPVLRDGLWKRLNEDSNHPLLNRAIQGRYAPGSTFKPITAIAALSAGYSPDDVYDCNGVYKLGTMRLRCWDTYGHGNITLRQAIEHSCNAYFCNAAHVIGYEPIWKAAAAAGLGRKTGVDLPGESSGLLPTPEWKAERLHERWTPGDVCHIAIGQGLLLTTPLQMAFACAAIANNGVLPKPRLQLGVPQAWNPEGGTVSGRETGWPKDALSIARAGMRDVAATGTGRRVQKDLSNGRKILKSVAAKTGTAEFDHLSVRRKNTWIIAFAPYETQATLALAVVVEDGESGGKTAAPIAHAVLAAAFGETEGESGQ